MARREVGILHSEDDWHLDKKYVPNSYTGINRWTHDTFLGNISTFSKKNPYQFIDCKSLEPIK